MAVHFRKRLKASLGFPGMHALAIPAEETLIGSKEVPLRRDQNLPDIVEGAFLLRDLLQQGLVLQRSVGVGLKVAEVPISSHPDFTRVIHDEGAHHGRRDGYFSPGDAVVFQNHTRHAEIEDAAAILKNAPDSGVSGAVFPGRVIAQNGHSDFRRRLRSAEGRKGQRQDCKQKGPAFKTRCLDQ